MKKIFIFAALILGCMVFAQDIKLPEVKVTGGKPLMECFAQRKSARSFADKELSPELLSGLFYAADGINRKDGRKTVPTARNMQNQEIYALTKEGVYLYQPKTHTLKQIKKGDFRKLGGKQAFHGKAAVVLLYVAQPERCGRTPEEKLLCAANHAGYASQNVYLFCASEGLSTVVCAMLDRPAVAKLMELPADRRVLFSQPVGFPL